MSLVGSYPATGPDPNADLLRGWVGYSMGGSDHSSGLGPVWDDFTEEVNLGIGLGLWRTWRRFSVGAMVQKY